MDTRADRLFVPADWKRWIAENILKGQHLDELTQILVKQGFREELARLEVESAARHPYIEAAQSQARQIKKRDWLLHTQQVMETEHGSAEVERRADLSSQSFHSDYCALNRPIVLTNVVADWPAITRWTPDYLRDRCGNESVEIQARRESNESYEIDKEPHRQTCQFGEFVHQVFFEGTSNDYYMTAANATANGNILRTLWDDIQMPEAYTDLNDARDRTFLWIGPTGTVTPLHHDLTNNFMAQVVGRKRIRMISPAHQPYVYNHRHCFSKVDIDNVDEREFPLFSRVHIYDLILNPGELLFLPVGWWHQVVALDTSITVTFTNFRGTNQFSESYSTYEEI